MACNPPYARGITGQWDKCRFPGVLRQDCYDYINFDYNCIPPPPTPSPTTGDRPCGSGGSSGGQVGVVSYDHSMPTEEGQVTFSYESYSIPDGFKVEGNGKVYFDTGGPVSGGETITFCKDSGVTSIKVTVTATGSGTAWNYYISCPEIVDGCGTPKPTNPPVPTPLPSCNITAQIRTTGCCL